MSLLDIWYSIPVNERCAYVPDISRIVVRSTYWKNKIQKLLPDWKVVTLSEAIFYGV